MSAGVFEISRYESSELAGQIMNIRVQPETIAAEINGTSNAAPAGAVTLPLFALVSGGNSEYGVKPRKVTLRFTNQGSLPAGYSGQDVTIPVLTEAAFASYGLGQTGTYLGAAVQVVGRTPERAR